MQYDAVPQELKQRQQWVTWRFEKEGQPVTKDTDGATKPPYNARTGHKASSTNPNTWTSFSMAVQAAQQRKHDGIGFMFSPDDPFTGIDLDDCIKDGVMEPWALDIVATMNSYTEISPSGTGVKIWVQGTIPTSVKTPQIEIYSLARYFTVTGQHFDSTPTTIRNVNGALTRLYESIKAESSTTIAQPRAHATVGDDHARQWAQRKLADAIRMVTLAPDGLKHDILLDAARLAGGASPYLSPSEIETALFAAIEGRAADKRGAQKTIRDGIRLGMSAPLPLPEPPPQPTFDQHGYACCPTHARRLDAAKNGNGYKCRAKDATTASGWCDFWWKGDGYVPPSNPAARSTTQDEVVAGEVIQTPKALQPFQLYRMGDLRNIPPVQWLRPYEVPDSLFTVLCGPSESGKSLQAVDYAMATARDHPDRCVVYVAPEGGSGYLKRCEAWLAHHGGEQPDNLVFILRAVPILDPLAVASFIASIRSFKPILIILDTLARCLVGGDENSAKDVGLFVEGCDEIRRQTNAAVLVVHHTGKSGNYRGSSALYGACDSWIDFANDDGLITLACGKAKDWKPFEPRYLRMVERAESVVLVPADQVSQRGAGLSEGQRKVLESLALDVFQGPGAKATQIINATGITEKTLYRILSRLKREGLVSQGNKGDPYTITTRGLDSIKAYHRALREKTLSVSLPDTKAQLSQLSPNSHELSLQTGSTVSHCHPPFKGGCDSESDSESTDNVSEDDLFTHDQHQTEITPVLDGVVSTVPLALDWEYLRARFDVGDYASIKTHCGLRRADVEMVLEQLEMRGRTPEGYA